MASSILQQTWETTIEETRIPQQTQRIPSVLSIKSKIGTNTDGNNKKGKAKNMEGKHGITVEANHVSAATSLLLSFPFAASFSWSPSSWLRLPFSLMSWVW